MKKSELRQLIREKIQKLFEDASTKLECMECGYKFKKKIGKNLEVQCPKCGSYDIELNETIKETPVLKGIEHTDLGFPQRTKLSKNEILLLKKFVNVNGVRNSIKSIKSDPQKFLFALEKYADKFGVFA